MFDLKTYLNQKQTQVNEAIQQFIHGQPSQRIVTAMTYSVMAGGKRLRPILCMAAAEAVGGDSRDVVPDGCAIEMIHTYSLIHDDLPAMDNDDLRRGKPTCHVAFDEATALLAGDALLTLAFQVLSTQDHGGRIPVSKQVPPSRTILPGRSGARSSPESSGFLGCDISASGSRLVNRCPYRFQTGRPRRGKRT